ncbi:MULTISPECIES: PAS domain S-box protein [Dietzia]|uniref:PAS domain S-box protein n=1 Tax=Dietzia TaxID=37914 RepID=UPI00232E8A9C|nr:PAS domain S-box protein [Dietzia maris]
MHDDPSLDYRDLLARLADVVYAVDTDGRFTYINPAGERIFGWDLADLIGEHFAKVIDPDALAETVEHFRLGMASADPGRFFETRILQPDGQLRDLEIHAGNIYRDGRLVGRQGVGRDMTELRRLQANLATKTRRLELLEEQQRAALEVYRRLNLMVGRAGGDPGRTEQALDAVESSLQLETARVMGLQDDLEIIALIADGYSNQEISDHVHLSVHTVKDRVSRITTRLGARSRAAVATRATEAGLLRSRQ